MAAEKPIEKQADKQAEKLTEKTDTDWEFVAPGGRLGDNGREYVSMSVAKNQVAFGIGKRLLQRLGWKAKDRIAVVRGVRSHEGELRLVHAPPGKQGYSLSIRKAGSATVTSRGWGGLDESAAFQVHFEVIEPKGEPKELHLTLGKRRG